MSKPKKKIVKKTVAVKSPEKKSKAKPSVQRGRSSSKKVNNFPLLFTWENYKLMIAGIVLIALGLALMSGGSMPSPDVWDDNIIYSFRRTVLAPIVILAGLGLEVYAIFK